MPRARTATRSQRGAGVAKNSHEIKHPIRRILAERPPIGREKGRQFLVDWYPGWESETNLKGQKKAMVEWNTNKLRGHTFKFRNVDVMKCSNPTEDNSATQTRLMLDTVLDEFQKWTDRPKFEMARELFDDLDWAYANTNEEHKAGVEAREVRETNPSAAEVMRRTYLTMRDAKGQSTESMYLIYGSIKVRYLGQVDSAVENARPDQRKSGSVISFLQSLFEPMLTDMEPKTWKTNATKHKNLRQLCQIAKRFVKVSAFVLKHPWPLMFTRLFLWSDTLINEYKAHKKWKFTITDGWENRSRDFFLHTYMDASNWELRPVDHVERTYLECRDRVGWHVLHAEVDEEDGVQEVGTDHSGDDQDEEHE